MPRSTWTLRNLMTEFPAPSPLRIIRSGLGLSVKGCPNTIKIHGTEQFSMPFHRFQRQMCQKLKSIKKILDNEAIFCYNEYTKRRKNLKLAPYYSIR